jgi:hypothetical protein
MNITAETAISIKIQKDEVRDILLDYIKRVAGGTVKKDMELVDIDGSFSDFTFIWTQNRLKEMNGGL